VEPPSRPVGAVAPILLQRAEPARPQEEAMQHTRTWLAVALAIALVTAGLAERLANWLSVIRGDTRRSH
jgi:hypothetical protein